MSQGQGKGGALGELLMDLVDDLLGELATAAAVTCQVGHGLNLAKTQTFLRQAFDGFQSQCIADTYKHDRKYIAMRIIVNINRYSINRCWRLLFKSAPGFQYDEQLNRNLVG